MRVRPIFLFSFGVGTLVLAYLPSCRDFETPDGAATGGRSGVATGGTSSLGEAAGGEGGARRPRPTWESPGRPGVVTTLGGVDGVGGVGGAAGESSPSSTLGGAGAGGTPPASGESCGASADDSPLLAPTQGASVDASTPVGRWYLKAEDSRLEVTIQMTGSCFTGTLRDEAGGDPVALSNISWDAAHRWLEFRRTGFGFFQWYRLSLVQGTVAGRFSSSLSSPSKPPLASYAYQATGWSPTYLDSPTSPRTWNVTLSGSWNAVLRVDANASGVLSGTLKVYDNSFVSGVQEEPEYQLTNLTWDGTHLTFARIGQVFTGTTAGRFISGTFTQNGSGSFPWIGARGEVLGFGLGSRTAQRASWRDATRARLANLTEGMRLVDGPEPASTVTTGDCTGCPFTSGSFPPERDDDPDSWPANYTLTRLTFSVPPGNRFDPDGAPPARTFNAYLAKPDGDPPAGGWSAVLAVNGHDGDAQALMTKSNTLFWHGESAARRQFVVLAIDVGHRPEWQVGPVVHPAIIGSGYTNSDWEEDGERAFDVRRGVDYLSAQSFVRPDRIFVAGLSLGGEVATIGSAMDPRVAMAVAAGYSPDMNVMDNNGNHPCYRWNRADIHEYVDISDYEGLIAPRPLVVETGLVDATFSSLATPFSADKQVTRRARLAYGPDSNNLIHYLHYDTHNFHIGDVNATNPSRPRGVLAASVTAPSSTSDMTWQTDWVQFPIC